MASPQQALALSKLWIVMMSLLLATGSVSGISWVTRQGTKLFVDGKPFYFCGCNAYWLVDYATDPGEKYLVTSFFQRSADLGLKVVRTWAFNHAAPASSGYGSNSMYHDEEQMRGLDFIIQQAGAKGVYLLLAAGNLWPHYVGPEVFLSAAGETGDVLTFYGSSKARALYKSHLQYLFNRVNTLTGAVYKDDPTIMGWDIMNEPRCPGCTDADSKRVHDDWLREMTDYARGLSPRQMMMMGTEGFFGLSDGNKMHNPGAGSACEGEDWPRDSALPGLDVATLHVYWRQTEGVRDKGWARMTFSEYASFIGPYIDLHVSIAASLGKPLLIEEFNILSGRFSESERAAIFSIVMGKLNASRQSSGALTGAMFWNGALQGVPDDGYNVYLDQARSPRRLMSLAAEQTVLFPGATHSRRLHENLHELDEFRRRGPRAVCAEAEARSFRPAYALNGVDAAQLLASVTGKTAMDVVQQACN